MYEALREKANKLPAMPGVYIMKDARGEVIYVGKAKILKNRVTSYFRADNDVKTAAMVSKVGDFDVIAASSEFEALVLESSLIKRHQPQYNIKLRDDKAFPFIRLEQKSEYPRFSIAGKTAADGAKYFGPFGGRAVTREILDTLYKSLKLPSCGKKFPRDIGKERPCLNHHMGFCEGYCRPEATAEEYGRSIRQSEMILGGGTKQLIAAIETEMNDAAENLRFEEAAQKRDRLRAIENLSNRQKVISAAFADLDAIGFHRGAKCCFTVIHYTEGKLSGKDYELLDEPLETDDEVISSLVRQYYSRRGMWAKTVLLPIELEDRESLERFLSEESGTKVSIEAPKRGDKAVFIETAQMNAQVESTRATTAAQRQLKTLEWLQKTLGLESSPERIEAFDVSNTGSDGIVAAMTVFYRGKPLKRDYRKFKIKGTDKPDDYLSMREAVHRRFKRGIDGDEKFSELPDLLLIDGGRGQASVAEKALMELGLKIPIYGMVKDAKHRTRALMTPTGEEIGISGNPAVFALIGNIQEETHRFAIEYHRSLRNGNIVSELDGIKGVGKTRKNELLKAFKTIKAIRAATIEELSAVVPKNTARAVFDHFAGVPEDA